MLIKHHLTFKNKIFFFKLTLSHDRSLGESFLSPWASKPAQHGAGLPVGALSLPGRPAPGLGKATAGLRRAPRTAGRLCGGPSPAPGSRPLPALNR